jgi:hypothetical protein
MKAKKRDEPAPCASTELRIIIPKITLNKIILAIIERFIFPLLVGYSVAELPPPLWGGGVSSCL